MQNTTIQRLALLTEFIAELRASNGDHALSDEQAERTAISWEGVLFSVPDEVLGGNDNGSLLYFAKLQRVESAPQVLAIFEAGANESAAMRQTYRDYDSGQSEPEPVGPNRQALQRYLSAHGVGEAQLAGSL